MTLRIIFIISLAISFSACSYQEPIIDSFDGIEKMDLGTHAADVALRFTMTNPNKKDITLNSSEVKLYVNEVYIGQAVLTQPSVLQKSGTHSVDLHMKVTFEISLAQMATKFGMAVLTNNLTMRAVGQARGSMGMLKRSFDIDHSERIKWSDLQVLVR